MRMAELSRRSEVPIPTIKYWLREGLLEPGDTTAPNQAEYGEGHLDRLRLIRALREAADLPIETLRRVLAIMDRHEAGARPEHLTIAVRALSPPLEVPEDRGDDFARARAQVEGLLSELGWDIDDDSPGRDDLIRALVDIHEFLPGLVTEPRHLVPYARVARELADREIPDGFDPSADPAAVLHFSVLGTVLFEPVLLALRKLAHVDRIRHVTADR